jgi:transcriptional regulator with XRE-family HTH domain
VGITALLLVNPIDNCVSSIRLRNMQIDPERPELTFARRMRELRESLGMPQTHVATTLKLIHGIKIDPTAITRIERGTRTLRLDEAVAIASVLDHTVDEMLRPALPPEEQLLQAEQEIEPARWRAARAVAEYEVSQRRLERLRVALDVGADLKEVFAEGGDDGEHR